VKVVRVIAFLFLASCVGNFNFALNDLKKSLSEKDVKSIIGDSSERKLYREKDILVYYIHNSVFDLFFSKTFPYFGFFPFNRTGKEFWVVLKDDKVIAFGYATDFGNRLAATVADNSQ
jgi:hypothetical protein